MDGASSKYIAELLKQLEELKRKKAHKERKLMKLKSCPSKSPQKNKTLNNSQASSCRKTDSQVVYQALKAENHDNQNNPASSDIVYNSIVKKEKFHIEKNKENFDFKKSDLPICEPNFTTKNNSEIETGISKSIEIVTLNQEHIKASDVADKIIEIGINKSIEIVTFNQEHMKVPNVTDKIIENILSTETISTAEPVIKKCCLLNNKNSNKFVEYNDANKSLVLTSDKNKSPESPEDLLDCNMSCFISSDVLLNSCDDKGKIIKRIDSDFEITNNDNYSKQTEMGIELITSELKISPPSLNPSSNESQQSNFDIFNFPKFSTPTYVNTSQSNIVKTIDNLQEKYETSRTSSNISKPNYKMSENYAAVPKQNISTLDKQVENEVLKNKFHSSSLKLILGSGLSSILDAHYGSPSKQTESKNEIFRNVCCDDNEFFSQQPTNEVVLKKRRLLPDDNTVTNLKQKSEFLESYVLPSTFENVELHRNKKIAFDEEYSAKTKSNTPSSFNEALESDNPILNEDLNFDNSIVLCSQFDSFADSQNISSAVKSPENYLHNNISSEVTRVVNELIAKVCENVLNHNLASNLEEIVETNLNINTSHDNITFDSEILFIPETEGLGLYFSKDTEEFLETSSLSQSFKHFEEKDKLLNVSSQSKLASPVMNKIVSVLKSSQNQINCEGDSRYNPRECQMKSEPPSTPECGTVVSVDAGSNFHDTDTTFLEDDTQELGKLKQVPYMNGENVQENILTNECIAKTESTLNFTCCLHGASNEPVIDAEIVLFNDVKYAFLQHKTQVHVWRQERNEKWVKIFYHQVEDMFSLGKMCISMDGDNLVIVMLLSNDQNCCLQFLLFEKDARIIKLMENTHWLEERHSKDLVLLCGLDGLMFATAQNNDSHEVSLHAFINLKENPRLMTAILGSTDNFLCSLCKIDKLPNALMGVNDSMLYIWHILEARLVTAVSLHPHDYLPIKNCFWATVEKGLIYFMTTCEGRKDFQVCQLLAANLATGFCQSAMTYTTLPSKSKRGPLRITKAAYLEPFLVAAHSNGAFLWSVTEEFCCASLTTQSEVTTISISRDFENWGLLAVGNNIGFVNCYNLN